mmetsp:Transcript_18065/g.51717  ORF Transcript_18065/g.51717 Transcript_18065/m.51717 type:complete len:243 (-) Transcript_18065:485-1213(-)
MQTRTSRSAAGAGSGSTATRVATVRLPSPAASKGASSSSRSFPVTTPTPTTARASPRARTSVVSKRTGVVLLLAPRLCSLFGWLHLMSQPAPAWLRSVMKSSERAAIPSTSRASTPPAVMTSSCSNPLMELPLRASRSKMASARSLSPRQSPVSQTVISATPSRPLEMPNLVLCIASSTTSCSASLPVPVEAGSRTPTSTGTFRSTTMNGATTPVLSSTRSATTLDWATPARALGRITTSPA